MISSIVSFAIALGIAYYLFLLAEEQDNNTSSQAS